MGKAEIKVENKNLWAGILLVGLGLLAPNFIDVHSFHIYQTLYMSIEEFNSGLLVMTAFKLVILNCIRGLPHYLGAFLIAESLNITFGEREMNWIRGLLPLAIIPLVYRLIRLIYGIGYDLGVPALIVLTGILAVEKLNLHTISIIKKSFIIILLLFGMQWMDIVPALDGFGFGRGETSMDVKRVAEFIDGVDVLNFVAVTLFVTLCFNAFLIGKILSDEHRLFIVAEKNKEVERELAEARLRAQQARAWQEMQSLVHDLKTPLTSIQALASISEMMADDRKMQTYMNKIVQAVDKLNIMISEILYEDMRHNITTGDLFDFVFAQISFQRWMEKIEYQNEAKNAVISANKVRLSRAIINGIENAYNALRDENGWIRVGVRAQEGKVYIDLEDNGVGIDNALLGRIWETGFSTKQSTGLGLNFMRDVVRNHGGSIEIHGMLNQGTVVSIILPEVNSH